MCPGVLSFYGVGGGWGRTVFMEGGRTVFMEGRRTLCEVGTFSRALGNILEQKMIERSWADLIVLDAL